MEQSELFSCRIDPETHDMLREMAKLDRVAMSHVVRSAIRELYARRFPPTEQEPT